MDDVESESLGNTLNYSTHLPMCWQLISSKVDTSALAIHNVPIIHLLQTLEDESDTQDVKRLQTSELLRIEAKINLILEFLAQILRKDVNLPEPCELVLSTQSITWSMSHALEQGNHVLIEVFMHPRCPFALQFAGIVKTVKKIHDGYQICVDFFMLDATTLDWLEKLIFRNHRKAIARQRAKG